MAWDIMEAFNGILRAMVSNPFYLLILLTVALMIPFSLVGISYLFTWLDGIIKVRGGWIRVRKKHSNGRWIEFWAKPTGRKVKIKGEEGMEFELPVLIEKDYMGYQSDTKGDFKEARKQALRDIKKEIVSKDVTKPVIPETILKKVIDLPSDYQLIIEANK